MPGDDHPRLAQRRGARPAELIYSSAIRDSSVILAPAEAAYRPGLVCTVRPGFVCTVRRGTSLVGAGFHTRLRLVVT